ncbi:kinase-like protein [Pleurotus eryngii]|uniref:non-specific serine/threonine protein kinase n=1 Tax=Pleurotus eryngii TaxID=5323 RepID=A0A9P6D7B8_PLEER|nr:kinase-like protein [Pleurotus eryngii]
MFVSEVARYLCSFLPTRPSSQHSSTHFCPRLGQTVKDGRYEILRKLGEGTTSSTWLVKDSLASKRKYLAAKILTVEASESSNEVNFLQAIERYESANPEAEGLEYLPLLLDHFISIVNDAGPSPRHHTCLVMPLYSTSVSALRRSAPKKRLPLYMVKSIIYMALQALETMHTIGIIHTDIKLDNFLFTNEIFTSDKYLEDYLTGNPAQFDPTGAPTVQPLASEWSFETSAFDAERMSVVLTDFSHAEWADQPPKAQMFCPPALRPPEVILEAGITTAVDIWAIGCLTFELLVGRWLFHPESGFLLPSEHDHLAKMMELTGQTSFPKSVLDRAKLRNLYFNKEGSLSRIPKLVPVTIEAAISNYNVPGLQEEDIREAADFIRSCLHLDGAKRKTAAELLKHSFPLGAFSCH